MCDACANFIFLKRPDVKISLPLPKDFVPVPSQTSSSATDTGGTADLSPLPVEELDGIGAGEEVVTVSGEVSSEVGMEGSAEE